MDGERVPDQGVMFLRIGVAHMDGEEIVVAPGFQSGLYVREGGRYVWRTD